MHRQLQSAKPQDSTPQHKLHPTTTDLTCASYSWFTHVHPGCGLSALHARNMHSHALTTRQGPGTAARLSLPGRQHGVCCVLCHACYNNNVKKSGAHHTNPTPCHIPARHSHPHREHHNSHHQSWHNLHHQITPHHYQTTPHNITRLTRPRLRSGPTDTQHGGSKQDTPCQQHYSPSHNDVNTRPTKNHTNGNQTNHPYRNTSLSPFCPTRPAEQSYSASPTMPRCPSTTTNSSPFHMAIQQHKPSPPCI